jgi:glycosyltransferase involved in cell wall biosynthesis
MEKLLTLAIPSFNMENYLEKCILSCICDNMQYLDIIIVNDGSIDKTSEIGHRLVEKYKDVVRIIDKKNGHYGSCVNVALDNAKGKYFRMLDPDDWCDTNALNSLLENIKKSNCDLIITVAEDRLLGQDVILRMDIPTTIEIGKIYDFPTFDCLEKGYKWLFCSHVTTYKTSLLRDIHLKLQEGICYTDNEYVFYPLDKVKNIIFYDIPVYQYYVGREDASTIEYCLKQQTEMWKVLKPMFVYFYKYKGGLQLSVVNNQRIIIAEIAKWILTPVFLYEQKFGTKSDSIINELQSFIVRDTTIFEQVKQSMSINFIPYYDVFCKTGKIMPYTLRLLAMKYLKKLKTIVVN